MKILKIIIAIVICELAGFIGTIFTTPAIPTWYASLNKPFFTPPNWLFAPVWTTLFFLMGIALYLVWSKQNEIKIKIPIIVFAIQFFLNVLWNYLFFGLQNPLAGLIGIILLWIAILATIIAFYKVSKAAAYLLIPYIVWVSIATALNYAVWILN